LVSSLSYLVSGSHSPEVGHVGNGADGEAAVDQAVVDEHVGHAEQRNPEALEEKDTWRVRFLAETPPWHATDGSWVQQTG
jgi:hypothetical protein